MIVARALADTVQARLTRDPAFRQALLAIVGALQRRSGITLEVRAAYLFAVIGHLQTASGVTLEVRAA